MEALTDIAQRGRKAKLQFPTALRERLIAECGFTLEEKTMLNLRADGLSIIEIADRRSLDDCADNSSRTVHRRKIRSYIRLLLERSNEHDVFGLLHRSQQIQRRHTRILRLHGKGVSVR